MLSMTGFGSGAAEAGGLAITCELRAVNHRFLDVSLKLPAALSFLEGDVRARLKERLARGRVAASLQITPGAGVATARLDPARLDAAIEQLRQAAAHLEEATGRPQHVELDHLLQVPGLFDEEDVALDREALRAATLQALDGAVDGLLEMKAREGGELAAEMRGRLDTLREHLNEVVKEAPQAATEAHERLEERVQQLVGDEIDPQRLAQEVAFLADRANINEECERLGVHIDHFRAALDEGGQVAKRLNFLLQEMHREVNTMGSKTSLMSITQRVIAMKEEVESMREQIQNLE
jgi:uncharacterized protein (TIGR00255 family)